MSTNNSNSRRRFLRNAGCYFVAAPTGLAFLSRLPHVSAEQARLEPDLVRFDDRIEPLVKIIEESSRDSLLERIAVEIRGGRSYREVLTALLLAGIRNVQPRPSVGFKFHCVLVVNACHLASLAGPDKDRWLPIFWALDYFKSSQAEEIRGGGWQLAAVHNSKVPNAVHARGLFIEAMDDWDEEKVDYATAGLVRTAGATEVFNLFVRYAARDYRSIGHKAIYLANAWRTLQVIGLQHAEPVLRSLAFALLNHTGEPNPAQSDLAADRPWRENGEMCDRIPDNWLSGDLDDGVPERLMEAFRQDTPKDAAELAVNALSRGVAPQSIWDGVFMGAGELLMRQPGIIGLHGLTTANAMHYLWRHAADDGIRRHLLLQACSFNPMFRQSAMDRGELRKETLEMLRPTRPDDPQNALSEIMAEISSNRQSAANKVYGFLDAGGKGRDLVDAARRVLFIKGRDAHDYKFSSAVLEDYDHVSPMWRDRFLALSVFNLKGSGDPDSGLVARTRAAFRSG